MKKAQQVAGLCIGGCFTVYSPNCGAGDADYSTRRLSNLAAPF